MNFRSLKKIVEPAVEPVTLAEAKAHLRVDISDDDSYIASLVKAAREWIEGYLDMTVMQTKYRMRLDAFPAEIQFPKPPMLASGTNTAVAVTYVASSLGNTATLSASSFRIDRDSLPGKAYPLYGGSWPSHLSDQNSVTVEWWGGYGDTPSSAPQKIRHALLMIVHHWYERRAAVEAGSMAEVPLGAKALLDMSKWGSYK
jgi:uncharacterized phiE125 gp8 family phage protein